MMGKVATQSIRENGAWRRIEQTFRDLHRLGPTERIDRLRGALRDATENEGFTHTRRVIAERLCLEASAESCNEKEERRKNLLLAAEVASENGLDEPFVGRIRKELEKLTQG